MQRTLVSICVADPRDLPVAKEAQKVLDELGIPFSLNLVSPHQTPGRLDELVKASPAKVFIGIAREPAALPGALAARTMRPVIGVPVAGAGPYDALVTMAQTTTGMPVATVGVDRAENAALLAAAVLAMGDETVQSALAAYRERQRQGLLDSDRELQGAEDR